MGLFGDLVSGLSGKSEHAGQQQYSSGSPQGPPPVSPPWYAEWDSRDNCWLFVNQQTGERTYTYPGPGHGQQQGGYGASQGQYGGGYGDQSGGAYQQQQQEHKQGGNGWKYAAAGAAGVAGGALLMHEGDDLKDDFEHDKYRMENRVDEFGNDVSGFPQNAAGWTGEQVGRVENFDDRVENRWDNAVNNVEDFPEDAARWGGQKVQEVEDLPQDIDNRFDNAVGDVENFDNRMDQAYDNGRDEQRYDDEY